MQKLQIDSQSLLCSTISFSNSSNSSKGQHYRGIAASAPPAIFPNDSINYVPSQISKQVPRSLAPTTTSAQSKSCSVIQFSLNAQFPKLQPLDIMVTPMDIENGKEDSISTSSTNSMIINDMIINEPPSLINNISSFKYCNDLNSYLVDNSDCFQVLNILNNILSNYNDDIDFKIDVNNLRIDGLVFINNYCVCWSIYIWQITHNQNNNDNNNKQTRFEFRRTSGDALASAKFWAKIQGLYAKQEKQMKKDINDDDDEDDEINEQPLEFISFDLDLGMNINDDNDQNDDHLSKSELNQLTESLVENSLFVVDELNYLYENMMENKNICYDILSYKPLMKQLINDSILNKDICVQRVVLLILDQLTDIKGHGMTNNQDFKLFDNINLLLNHQRQLIRKYTIRLLSKLSQENEWNINDISKHQMIKNLKLYQNEFANHLTQEINKVNGKLMMK